MNSEFQSSLPAHSLESEFRRVVSYKQQQPKQPHRRKQFLSALLNFFTGQQTISIRPKMNNGKMQWIVYDPHQNVRVVFETEQAVRIWIEQRHKQK
ncbi:MAG: hypothetical protein AB8B99_00435 [Phormidesmis sp.]